jgi:Ca2+/H+ antiporter, TMEM165/GDT1 family
MLEQLWLYVTVFVLAATPWIEILVVIPFGIGVGLNPIGVGVVAFVGNVIPIILIVVGYERFQGWWARRRGRTPVDIDDESWSTGRRARAMRVLRKYGVPGLSLVSPILTGAHLGAVLALLVRARRDSIILWMVVSLLAWTLVITVASWLGIGWLTSLF